MTEELDIGNDFSIKMEIETTMNATAWPQFNSAAARQQFWHNDQDKPLIKPKHMHWRWQLKTIHYVSDNIGLTPINVNTTFNIF